MNLTIKTAFLARFANAMRVRIIRDEEIVRVIVTLADRTRLSFTFACGSDDDEYVFVNDADTSDMMRVSF